MLQQQAQQTPISEVMHLHPHCVTEQQSVQDLVSLFLDQGISAAPVVDDNGKPIGFISKTDVVREIKGDDTAQRPEKDVQFQPWWDADRLSRLTVGEIMTPTLYTFSPTTTVADAVAAMAFEGMHHLPVVADSGKLVGMLSVLDVLDWLARHAGYRPADGRHGQIFERPLPSMAAPRH
jgi:CBS domain-containing protein